VTPHPNGGLGCLSGAEEACEKNGGEAASQCFCWRPVTRRSSSAVAGASGILSLSSGGGTHRGLICKCSIWICS
uniref:Uncharacterized protein n=1 Tax=Aegilops tauschii subsp. strangulata TaxID=200361 RepID=A0A453GNF1_AEGTS